MNDVPQGDPVSAGDTPTHRMHLLQLRFNLISTFIQQLQARRAVIVEKVRRVKASNALSREATVNKQLIKAFTRIEKNLKKAESMLDIAADDLNKNRGLFLELSDGEVILEKTELTGGSITARTAD